MTAPPLGVASSDPLTTLREYATLAPWSLRDLATLSVAILDASSVFPINAAARARPTERTIRFYVTRGLVSPPEGRGTAAIYSYRHLLQVLAIKLRQMEGATLEAIVKEFTGLPGDMIERRVAGALKGALPPPAHLELAPTPALPRGKVGRAWPAGRSPAAPRSAAVENGRVCRRILVGQGLELLVDEHHPLFRLGVEDASITSALRQALTSLLPQNHEDR
jgi:hypothetical protein